MTGSPASDPTMDAIAAAVTEGRSGNLDKARRQLLALWQDIGVNGDPLHRCSLAHYLADLYEHPAQALTWDVRALDAAHSVTDQRTQNHHGGLHIAGFFPSLHLNLADNYCRLGSFDAAREHIDAAKECSSTLADDPYGDLIRGAIGRVDAAIAAGRGADWPSTNS
ncbi:hypothetical protein [Rhodococcus sp. UNC23MFCrub1.1]|uniref:hypothetical protein n=1 Tax=Rhodococcus sp. UNC23MFCrub1.1 TaxID=1449068 RepID=UPI0006916DF8|nr:hypothetical protein [Rhodococcus sp. UNC23MFCrub1.1]